MYANYIIETGDMKTFTDFDVFLNQFVIEKENFGGAASEFIPFTGLPLWLQNNWRPMLQETFAQYNTYFCEKETPDGAYDHYLNIEHDGTCRFTCQGSRDLVYNRFAYRREAGTENCVLICFGFTLSVELAAKRERVQLIDSILADL